MNARERLERYLDQVRRRLQAALLLRATAAVVITVFVVTFAAVWAAYGRGWFDAAILAGRIALALALVAIAGLLLFVPLRRLRTRDGAPELERHLPAQSGRIETYLDLARRGAAADSPLADLLAEDAASIAERTPVDEALPRRRLLVPAAIAASLAALLALIMGFGGSYWGYGARHLWLGAPLPKDGIAARSIAVTPGDATVRRNQDLPVRALVKGVRADDATMHVRFGEADKWESAPMRAGPDGQFELTLYALREPVHYYVTAGGIRSPEHRIAIVDLPRVERVRVTYTYPDWTGLAPKTEDDAADIEAVAGTAVRLEVQTTAPLEAPALVVNGVSAPLEASGARASGSFTLKEAGKYRIDARVGNEVVAVTDERDINLVEDEKPAIEIAKPGRDWKANSIEEVPVSVSARDDFRVQGLELRYAVNGGAWQSIPLGRGGKEVDARTMLRLEDLGGAQSLTPGDIVTYYAVARDHKQSVQTDMYLVEVQPFERRYTQGQAGDEQGGGDGGQQENEISERQRQILLATWNLVRNRNDSEDESRMLAELQSTLADQARTLAERARARTLAEANAQIRKFVEHLDEAVKAMDPAVRKLGDRELQAAISDEQRALQSLLRAEALFSDIRVAFQQSSGGGGSQAGRDLAEMFELEMDTDKNQYETEASGSSEKRSQELDDATRKLRELAQRQERLARETGDRTAKEMQEQRWQQEQLRREAEELKRRLEQLAQRERSQQRGPRSRQSSASGDAQSSDQGASEAAEQIEKALDNMRGQGSSDTRSARAASQELRKALERMQQDRQKNQSGAGGVNELQARARELLDKQQRGERELKSTIAEARQSRRAGARLSDAQEQKLAELADEKRQLRSELELLSRDMQQRAQESRRDSPGATKELGEAVSELAESNASSLLRQSATDIEWGRALQAAAREGLITEAMKNLEKGLDEAAQVASREARERKSPGADPQELLAQLGELRRALEDAQRGEPEAADSSSGEDSESKSGSAGAQGSKPDRSARQGSPGRSNESPNGNGGGSEGDDPARGDPGGERVANAGAGGPGAWRGGRDWGAWDPRNARDFRDRPLPDDVRRRTEAIGERLRDLSRDLPGGTLSAADLAALRQLADRLRGRGDPMAPEYGRMLDTLDQLELATLKAASSATTAGPARATAPSPDSPRYRENVAEYYRRLGSGK